MRPVTRRAIINRDPPDFPATAVAPLTAALHVPPASLSVLPATGRANAVVLVLHGGKAASRAPVRRWSASRLRMVPIARAVHSAARGGVAVWSLTNGVLGWNGEEATPVSGAREMLDRASLEHPGAPVVLLGHSMGARTGLRVAGHPAVRGLVGLAPWFPAGEPVDTLAGRRLAVLHGTRDRWTDPVAARDLVRRARPVADCATFTPLRGAGHFMFRRAGTWHRLAAAAVLDMLGEGPPVG